MKLELSNRKKSEKCTHSWELNDTFEQSLGQEETSKEIRKYLETDKNKDTSAKIYKM